MTGTAEWNGYPLAELRAEHAGYYKAGRSAERRGKERRSPAGEPVQKAAWLLGWDESRLTFNFNNAAGFGRGRR